MILAVSNFSVRYRTPDGLIRATDDVSFTLDRGETLAIVGESGSGKSAVVLNLLRLLPCPPAEIVGGSVVFEGEDLVRLPEPALQRIRGGRIGFIFQDPMSSLNPVMTVGEQIMENLRRHLHVKRPMARARAAELLAQVGISDPESRLSHYPHQFSGGMRQRVMIAIALACDPVLLIADEPTTALDVTIQAQIIDLIKRLQVERQMAVIWITHDLGVVAQLSNRVLVMYAGRVMEEAPIAALFEHPRHPYTRALLRSAPRIDGEITRRLPTIEGLPPNLINYPSGCPFAARCSETIEACSVAQPPMTELAGNHRAACLRLEYTSSDRGALVFDR